MRKLPIKIQSIKNLFKDDNEYSISDGVDPESNIRFITICWKENE